MENLAPKVASRVMRELAELTNEKSAVDGVSVFLPSESNLCDIHAKMVGPQGTPFEGGISHLRLALSRDFPHEAPKGYFLTKIFHPNVSPTGEICVNTLKKDWSPELGLKHVLTVIKCLLIDPNPESAFNEDAGKLLLEDYAQFAQTARIWTDVYAEAAERPAESAASADGVPGSSMPGDGKPKPSDASSKSKKKSLKRL
ncbi:Ubiquitin-conjugating enzyme E2 S-B [Porphyridium purpureum]|uniref:E2 ubiquitin-conjugating enzyme n=1 Tax=Porphyridium purpureum TaxID=35688 RepID=A0A5J4YL23_PORPP|nr:Ubiquitin-conjugating enzyme E2 S-B [Porphyridium purpureum]|eukprot:POR4765..scf244_11